MNGRKKAVILTSCSTYESRADAVRRFLQKAGFEVKLLVPDFDHHTKKQRKRSAWQQRDMAAEDRTENARCAAGTAETGTAGNTGSTGTAGITATAAHALSDCGSVFSETRICSAGNIPPVSWRYLPMLPYQRNLSVQRMRALARYAKTAVQAVEEEAPDLLYVLLPANSLARTCAAHRKNHADCKLVFDVCDLWPESLPVRHGKNIWPCSAWRRLRDAYLPEADVVIAECSLFAAHLKRSSQCEIAPSVVYWPQQIPEPSFAAVQEPEKEKDKAEGRGENKEKSKDKLHVCYLGAVNHIIDIEGIAALLHALQKKKDVVCHIIGTGENYARFVRALRAAEIEVKEEGVIYDTEQKQSIFEQCSFGINMMKDTVCVGLTTKSVEYLAAGLPLLNNIPSDTWTLVERERIGINIKHGGWREEELLDEIVQMAVEIKKTRPKVRAVYEAYFSENAFEAQMRDALEKIVLRDSGREAVRQALQEQIAETGECAMQAVKAAAADAAADKSVLQAAGAMSAERLRQAAEAAEAARTGKCSEKEKEIRI